MQMMQRMVLVGLVGLTLSGVGVSANQVGDHTNITQQSTSGITLEDRVEEAISIQDNRFCVNQKLLLQKCSTFEAARVNDSVTNMNKQLNQLTTTGSRLLVADDGGMTMQSNRFVRRFGKTQVKFYWWGVRVWLNQDHVQSLVGTGIGLSGYFIPGRLIGAACVALGANIHHIKSGIRFDLTYLNVGSKVSIANVAWQ
ncbi:hypothetical protein ACRHK7_02585 [Weissella tructae]|uniref:Uncharacterized protein n=1 Tax=Weissella ceti TaxID=759620 RepID=A0A088GIF4_9LACO|nr:MULTISPECIES: hypothetical protein [Weissella]AIM63435.1 hypothetical protein WS74_1185 [Weissella ceti]AIM64770.1 hypothetical protein WS105_1180 [Weissella ceti]ELA07427.1 hypothetical protein WCNC_03187 [Weissella ceti NC36]QVV91208.1 hypothetical protein KHQ32_06205 [Weissella tructae]